MDLVERAGIGTIRRLVSVLAHFRLELSITLVVLLSAVTLIATSAVLGFWLHVERMYAPYIDGVNTETVSMAPTTAICLLALVAAITILGILLTSRSE